ncbi:MAG: HEAT repeat domain-containing protein [Myxococcales bacterium]|nr:HEAT repeat domain-containing protein [Myxococcales bacterium]
MVQTTRWNLAFGLFLLSLLWGCSYGFREARNDAKSEDMSARNRALDYLIDYISKTTGSKEDVGSRQEAVRLVSMTGLPRSVGPLRMILMHESDPLLRRDSIRGLAKLRSPQALTELRGALKDRDIDVRMTAAAALGKLGDKRALRSLLDATKDPNPAVRAATATALSELGAERAIPYLVRALDDDNVDVQQAAQKSLLRFGEAAVSALIPYLSKPSSGLQARIVSFLPDFGQIAFLPLVQAFRVLASQEMAKRALSNLTRDAQSWPLLVRLTQVREKKEAEGVIQNLSTLGTLPAVHAIFVMWDDMPVVVKPFFRVCLGKIAQRSGDEGRLLLSRYANEGDDYARRSTALLALGQTGPAAIELIRPHLASKKRAMVIAGIRALGQIKKPAIPSLLPYADSEDEELRYTAIQQLGGIPSSRAVETLIKQLKHPSAKIRIAALEALGEQRDRSAVPHARDLLTDPVNNVVLAATQTLLLLGDQQNVKVYIAALKYGPYPPEPTYVETLGRLADIKAVPLLRQLMRRYLRDWKGYIRSANRMLRNKRRRAQGMTREQLEEAVATDLSAHAARNVLAVCSFVESVRALQRYNQPVKSLLKKSGYRHKTPMNPLLKPNDRCPWPAIAPGP